MRRAVICVTAGLTAVAIGFGLNSATSKSMTESSDSNRTTTPAISIWEIHIQAHPEFFPVQHLDDLSLVFTETLPQTRTGQFGAQELPPWECSAARVRSLAQRRGPSLNIESTCL